MEQQPQPSSSATTTTTSSSPSSSQQRRELQGPRPSPLSVRKDSHKIRKPPPPQPAGGGGGGGGAVQQVRQPVIIYTVSPKVVHAEPGEFMSVVQRLTGARTATASSFSSSSRPAPPPHHHQIQMPSSSSSLPFQFPFLGGGHHMHAPSSSSSAAQLPLPPPALDFPFQLQHQQQAPAGGAAAQHDHLMIHQLSPAARLAAIQQAAAAAASARSTPATADDVVGGGLQLPSFPSILSPGSLPAISPSFFSPPAPPGNAYPGISLFGGLVSPALFLGSETTGMNMAAITAGASHQNVTMSTSSSLQEASPSTVTPYTSAGAAYYWDLFNNQHSN